MVIKCLLVVRLILIYHHNLWIISTMRLELHYGYLTWKLSVPRGKVTQKEMLLIDIGMISTVF